MKLLNKKIDYRHISLLCVLFFPILKFNIASIATIVFTSISIFAFYSSKEKLQNNEIRYFFISSSFTILLLLTLLFSSDLKNGFGEVQRGISILIFPLVILLFNKKIEKKQLEQIFQVFVLSSLLATIYIYFELFLHDSFKNLFSDEVKFWNHPFRDVIFNLKYLDLHPSYYSMWILFSSIYMIDKLFKAHTKNQYILIVLLLAFFIFTSIIFSARAPLIGFFIAVFILLLFKIKSVKIRFITVTSLSLLILLAVTQISFLKSRFIDEFSAQKFRPPVGAAHTSTNIRVGIYQCTWDIFKENKWIGVGVGDVQSKLNLCYSNFHTRVYEKEYYNTHNSYFNLLLSGGIFALLIYLMTLYFQIRLAINSKNYLYLSFLILIMCCLLFENVFSRMHGAMFYALFNAVFLNYILKERKVN